MPKVRFTAKIEWGKCDSDVSPSELPGEFTEAKKLWESKDPANLQNAASLLAGFLRCTFIPSNLFADVDDILVIDDDVNADKVEITGLDFSSSSLPSVKAVSEFSFEANGELSQDKLDAW